MFDHPINILPWVGKPKLTAGNIKSKKQYISIPSVWRNYYDLIGYSRDARAKEVWLTPILYNTDRMEGAYFISPETDGTIDAAETGNGRTITLRTTNDMHISGIHLRDDFGADVAVRVNGKACRVRRVGEGYAKELVAKWKGKADASGATVEVVGRRNAPRRHTPAKPDRDFATAFKPCAMSPFEGLYAAKADRLAGTEVKGGIVTSCNNFDYILFANVDFGKGGTSAVAIRVNSKYEGSELEVALDDNSGAAVASCKLPCTGGEWLETEIPVAKIKGTHNVVLRFFGSHPDNLMDIDYIKFK